MIDDDRLRALLRSAMPPVTADPRPARDLWPRVVNRIDARARWSWPDIGLATAVTIALVSFPELLWLVAYHL